MILCQQQNLCSIFKWNQPLIPISIPQVFQIKGNVKGKYAPYLFCYIQEAAHELQPIFQGSVSSNLSPGCSIWGLTRPAQRIHAQIWEDLNWIGSCRSEVKVASPDGQIKIASSWSNFMALKTRSSNSLNSGSHPPFQTECLYLFHSRAPSPGSCFSLYHAAKFRPESVRRKSSSTIESIPLSPGSYSKISLMEPQ